MHWMTHKDLHQQGLEEEHMCDVAAVLTEAAAAVVVAALVVIVAHSGIGH